MSEILSQEEVDSLLAGLDSGKIDAETDTASDHLKTDLYDFSRQDRIYRGRIPALEMINERFSRKIRATMSSLLRTNVNINPGAVQTLKFKQFIRSLPLPTSLHIFRMDPLKGHALMVFETQLVFNLIDTFFGGKATGKAKIIGRDFTTIEEKMIKKVVTQCLKNFEDAWEPVRKIEAALIKSEVNSKFAEIVLPSDIVIVTEFEIELQYSAGKIILCLPCSMLEPFRNMLTAGFQAKSFRADKTWINKFKKAILDSTIELSVQLGSTKINGERLLHLKTGDIIQLDQHSSQALSGLLEGLPKLKGFPQIQKGFQAFRIEKKFL